METPFSLTVENKNRYTRKHTHKECCLTLVDAIASQGFEPKTCFCLPVCSKEMLVNNIVKDIQTKLRHYPLCDMMAPKILQREFFSSSDSNII